ncbi:hypothetical protein [Mangrovimonas sp. DI 80]|uniref:hypothetical protein n=1 Tax=Mangrovimonas sp. DI 80 TaxID=1779330 RepID=UPI0009787029|nr:hypothetical protein [Mangrovimonas sp. DI 80]OMP30073.1 hypothetical protein BKM32_14440 [Mangrovimonas sp. DI 80]
MEGYRENMSQSVANLLEGYRVKSKEIGKEAIPIEGLPENKSKYLKWLWNRLLEQFKKNTDEKLIQDKLTIPNLKTLLFYFVKDNRFFRCERLRSDLSKPSFSKGLFIVGGFGIGKTEYMKALSDIFKKNVFLECKESRFKIYNAHEIVDMYESCQTPFEKKEFKLEMMRGVILIDDFGAERVASNYGHVELLVEILEKRYALGKRTYVTCNYLGNTNDLESTLMEFGERYGGRMYDRFFKMFNFIEFKGKSMRK